jgi:hypothetical protein
MRGPEGAVFGVHCVIYVLVRDGMGYIMDWAQMLWGMRAVGDFTFSCASPPSSPSPCVDRSEPVNLQYNQLKRRATDDMPDRPLSASQYLSAEVSEFTYISFLSLVMLMILFHQVAVMAILTAQKLITGKLSCSSPKPHAPNDRLETTIAEGSVSVLPHTYS